MIPIPGVKALDMLRLIGRGGPALCNVAVTNSCNAACDFCNFARGKVGAANLRWIDASEFERALSILHQRDIRYVSLFGGEPLLHPRLADMIAMVIAKGMGPGLITNGWLLDTQLDKLAAAGLKNVDVSIDAAAMEAHELNRGLPGLGQRIRAATSRMPSLGMTATAQVTMSKLITNYRALIPLLQDMGFQAVAFSYPQRARLGSSSLAWSADSSLVNFTDSELLSTFDAVDDLRSIFPVRNPSASIADMKRHIRREKEQFACYGGYKSFYMDWNYTIWRCDGCTACIADCYRDSSVMLHFAVSIGDALDHLKRGRIFSALKTLADRRNAASLYSIAENAPILSQHAKLG